MNDLTAAMAEFWSQVDAYAPDDGKRLRPVLDALVAWSERHPAEIQFVWHEGEPGKGRQFLIKYCRPGVPSPFWAAEGRRCEAEHPDRRGCVPGAATG